MLFYCFVQFHADELPAASGAAAAKSASTKSAESATTASSKTSEATSAAAEIVVVSAMRTRCGIEQCPCCPEAYLIGLRVASGLRRLSDEYECNYQ